MDAKVRTEEVVVKTTKTVNNIDITLTEAEAGHLLNLLDRSIEWDGKTPVATMAETLYNGIIKAWHDRFGMHKGGLRNRGYAPAEYDYNPAKWTEYDD